MFRKIAPMEAEIQPKKYLFSKESAFLLKGHDQTYINCSACVESSRYGVSGKSVQRKRNRAGKVLCYPSEVPLIIYR